MSVLNTPYPHPSIRAFSKVLGLISVAIVFVLLVFQPFGTTSYTHPYKRTILFGYGIVTFVFGLLTYGLCNLLVSDQVKDKWTVRNEVLQLFIVIMVCQSASYFYYSWIFTSKISLTAYLRFLRIATMVALLPNGFYLLYIYQKYKDVRYASFLAHIKTDTATVVAEAAHSHHGSEKLSIEGAGKQEKYNLELSQLSVLKAEDNYVVLYILQNKQLLKCMIRVTMAEVERQLPSDFVRIHRSYLVNKNHVELVTGNVTNTKVKICNIPEYFPVSRTKVDQMRELAAVGMNHRLNK